MTMLKKLLLALAVSIVIPSMAFCVDLTITAANIVPVDGYGSYDGVAGATITAGQVVYVDTADSNKIKLCDANGSAIASKLKGISVHAALSGQPVKVQTNGNLGFGAILTVGQIYCVSATAGGICPYADLTTGDKVNIIGVASTTSNLVFGINATEITKP